MPDGDLFEAIGDGRASVVTDRIETFTETGIQLESGAELEADLIVTATGSTCVPLGGIEIAVDGARGRAAEDDGLQGHDARAACPNLAFALGYTNASWTLKCDLTCEYVCRLLNHMDAHGYAAVHAAQPRPVGGGGAVHRLHLGLRPARDRQVPQAGLEDALAAHQNYARDIFDAAVRHARRRRDGVLQPAPAGPRRERVAA